MVYLLMGYPASGKSTIASYMGSQGYTIFNRDTAGGKVSDLLVRMKSLLSKSKKVLLDNTFPTAESRKPFIELAAKHNVPITCIWLTTTIEQAQFNACQRMIRKYGKLLKPEEIKAANDPNIYLPVVLFKYRKEFETPSTGEGFAEIQKREFHFVQTPEYHNSAIIFDYDGTLRITKSGANWPSDPKDVVILKNRRSIIQDIKNRHLLGASNQSGIAKGTLKENDARVCFDQTNKHLGIDIDYEFCPHKVPPISCWCRKPMPGIAVHFIEKYKLDPSKCLVVGNMTSDKTFAHRSKMQFEWAKDFFRSN